MAWTGAHADFNNAKGIWSFVPRSVFKTLPKVSPAKDKHRDNTK